MGYGPWTMDQKRVKPQNKQLQIISPEARSKKPAASSELQAAIPSKNYYTI